MTIEFLIFEKPDGFYWRQSHEGDNSLRGPFPTLDDAQKASEVEFERAKRRAFGLKADPPGAKPQGDDAAPTPPIAIEWLDLRNGFTGSAHGVVRPARDRLHAKYGCTWFRLTPIDIWVAIEGWIERPSNQGAPPTEADIPRPGFV